MTRVLKQRAAFTLIEVLVTLVILSTGIVIVLRALQSSVVGLEEARDVLFGTLLCREKLVDIETDIRTGLAPPPTGTGAFEAPYDQYRWSIQSERDTSVKRAAKKVGKDDSSSVVLYKVTVDVWHDGREPRQTASTFLRYP